GSPCEPGPAGFATQAGHLEDNSRQARGTGIALRMIGLGKGCALRGREGCALRGRDQVARPDAGPSGSLGLIAAGKLDARFSSKPAGATRAVAVADAYGGRARARSR